MHMHIALGSDHAAYGLKRFIADWLSGCGHAVSDLGATGTERSDYCDYGFLVAKAVSQGRFERGLLFCGTGVGISICANKVRGIRAVVCSEPYSAMLSRAHNDTNILALGARVVGPELAKMIVETWLRTDFEGGRHADRLRKIIAFEAE
jgi:ribose 5-phosphate isomerase B